MNELVFKSSKGNPVTTSLTVAEEFEKDHKNVLRDIENLSCSQEFRRLNFALSSYKNSQNKTQPMYVMTKDGFSFLAMGYTGSKAGQFKEKFIEAFNQMEAALKSLNPTNLSKLEILQLAIESEKKALALEAENKKLAPKAEFAERVIDTETRVDIGQAAKLLKLPFGRNTFFRALRECGIFFKNRNEPKQEFIERGYFELFMVVIPTEHHGDISASKITVTQKGLFWLSKQFKGEYTGQLPTLNAI